MYNILETKIEFKDGKIDVITVLVEMSKNDIRAIQATTKPMGGYMFITPSSKLNDDLLQEVAGYGMEVNCSKFFKGSKHQVLK